MREMRAAQGSHPCGSRVDCNGKGNKSAPNNGSCRRSHRKKRNKWETWQWNKKWDEMSMHSGSKSRYKPESHIPRASAALVFGERPFPSSLFNALLSFSQPGWIYFITTLLQGFFFPYTRPIRLTIYIDPSPLFFGGFGVLLSDIAVFTQTNPRVSKCHFIIGQNMVGRGNTDSMTTTLARRRTTSFLTMLINNLKKKLRVPNQTV